MTKTALDSLGIHHIDTEADILAQVDRRYRDWDESGSTLTDINLARLIFKGTIRGEQRHIYWITPAAADRAEHFREMSGNPVKYWNLYQRIDYRGALIDGTSSASNLLEASLRGERLERQR